MNGQANSKVGEIICDLPPVTGNPRNSEGAFLTLNDGRILFVYSRFKGSDYADHATADIYALYGNSQASAFTDERLVLTCEGEEGVNIMSLSLMRMQNGDIGLFYLVRTTYSLMRMYMRRSSDEGKTFGERVLCTPQEGFFVVNNDRVTRLKSGRIIIPAAIHRKGFCESPDEEGSGYYDSRSDSVFFLSDDDGVSWRVSKGKCCLPYHSVGTSGLQEPGIIELSDDVLWGWARTDLGRQYEMLSVDGGNTWTSVQPSRFTSPNSPLCMKRMPNGGILAVWNPVPIYNGKSDSINGIWTGGRTPFVAAISNDNGKTFSEPIVLEDDPESGYCYTAIHFVGDYVLLAYCAGGGADKVCLSRTRIRKIELNQLEKLVHFR